MSLDDFSTLHEDDEEIMVIRLLVYRGKRGWVEGTLEKSFVKEEVPFTCPLGTITVASQWEAEREA